VYFSSHFTNICFHDKREEDKEIKGERERGRERGGEREREREID